MLVLPKEKPVDVEEVDAAPTIAIEDEEVVVVDLPSVQPLSDEDEPGPKMPTLVERVTRARAREVAAIAEEEGRPGKAKGRWGGQEGAEIGALEIGQLYHLGM
jgi:hypothetical protein